MRKLWALEQELARAELEPKIRQLRTNKLKEHREARDGAIFAHGMAEVLSTKVYMARGESGDHDFMLSWVTDDRTQHFCPVQLKELPSKKRNTKITLDSLLLDAKKYAPSENTAFAVYISGRRRIDTITIPKGFPFKQLWFFGGCSEDRERWFLYGDALEDSPVFTYFTYPH